MATKKKTTKKTSTRGNTYSLTATGAKHLAEVAGQNAEIRDVVSKRGPITAAEIGKALPKIPKENIAYYLSIWKSDGYVKFGPKK